MNAVVFDFDQRSDEWLALRAGLVTGSCAPTVTAVRKRGEGPLKKQVDLVKRLVCERLTKQSLERTFDRTPDAMQHGMDVEPDAVAAYEAFTGRIVRRVGFVKHHELQAGCSPDGYIGDWHGVVECKCPNSTTHLDYLQANAIPEEYVGQLIHTLFITGAHWVDFVSFDPRFPEPMRLFIKRLERDQVQIDSYELLLRAFLTHVDREYEQAVRLAAEVAVA